MAFDGTLESYIGQGLAASRPSAPNVDSVYTVLWYSTDTKVWSLYNFNAAAWVDLPQMKAPVTKTANYTLASGDEGQYIRMNVAAANTLTVPANSSVAFKIGTEITIFQKGAGATTIVAGAGVTINTAGTLILAAQYAAVALKKVGTDEWDLIGYTG